MLSCCGCSAARWLPRRLSLRCLCGGLSCCGRFALAGAFGEVALFRWQPGSTFTTPDGLTLPRHGQVAVKSLLPSVTRDPQAVADFRREVELLSKLSHSCLVICYGTGTRPATKGGPPRLFVAMQSVTGGDLRSIVVRAMNGTPRLYRNADVVRWAHDMARGLHYLHTRKPMIVHRDLKLENVLIDGARRLVRGAPLRCLRRA